jgi:hypothetical protein
MEHSAVLVDVRLTCRACLWSHIRAVLQAVGRVAGCPLHAASVGEAGWHELAASLLRLPPRLLGYPRGPAC